MSGTRFARNGRWRLILCGGALILLLTMLVIFHNQQDLDEKRERLRSLNEQLQSIVEQKYHLEQNNEHDKMEQMETRRSLEEKLKELNDLQRAFDKLERSHKSLQVEHSGIRKELGERTKQHLDETSELKKKLQSVEHANNAELKVWKEKYDIIFKENKRLEVLVGVINATTKPNERITELERIIADCRSSCDHKLDAHVPLSKPLHAPDVTTPTPASKQNGHIAKSFGEQELVSELAGQYHIDVKIETNTTEAANANKSSSLIGGGTAQKLLPAVTEKAVGSLILNSVENFQILPNPLKKTSAELELQLKLEIDKLNQLSSTEASKMQNAAQEFRKVANHTSSSTSLTPLRLPPNQRKLPENVAPIPAYFDDVVNQKLTKKDVEAGQGEHKDTADIATGGGAKPLKSENNRNDGNNNRYENVISDLEARGGQKLKKDVDSGAHENDVFMNGENFNLPPADGNFFEGIGSHKDDENLNDILDAGAANDGDIAVKNRNHILNAENLNNEIVGDQGKEFPADGLHLDDGGNDEDGDEDDYSNMAARQQGVQAIRN